MMSANWPGWHGEEGHYDSKRRVIRLAPMEAKHIQGVLLHEMCHIGTPGHGKAFLAKLHRLKKVKDGWVARWAKKEDFAYRNSQPVNSIYQDYLDSLNEWAMHSPRPRFRLVVRAIAHNQKISQKELLEHRGIWLKRAWNKAIRENNLRRKWLTDRQVRD
jgi:hypothetical protein